EKRMTEKHSHSFLVGGCWRFAPSRVSRKPRSTNRRRIFSTICTRQPKASQSADSSNTAQPHQTSTKSEPDALSGLSPSASERLPEALPVPRLPIARHTSCTWHTVVCHAISPAEAQQPIPNFQA